MSTSSRTINCPTCHNAFPVGTAAISMCPRCGERVLVPQSDEPPEERVVDVAPPVKEVASVAVECQLCNSRYYAKPSKLGQMMKCPDCHTENVVKQAASRHEKPRPAAIVPDDEADFKLSEPVDTPQYQALSRDALEFERAIRSAQGLDSEPPAPTSVPARVRPASRESATPPPEMEDGLVLLEPMESKATTPPPPPHVPNDPGEEIIDLTQDDGPPGNSPPIPRAPVQQSAMAPQLPAGLAGAEGLEILDHEVPFSGGNFAPPAQTPAPSLQPPPQPVVPNYATPARAEDIELFPEDRVPVALPPRPVASPPPPPVQQSLPPYSQDEDSYAPPPMAPPASRPEWKPVVRLPQADARDNTDYGAQVDLKELQKAVKGFLPSFGPSDSPDLPPELAKRKPFSLEALRFFLQPGILGRCVALILLVLTEFWVVGMYTEAMESGGYAMIGAMLMFVTGFLPSVFGFLLIAMYCFTIVQDTANGAEKIESWPELSFFSWFEAAIYFTAAFFLGGLPGALISAVFNCAGISLLTPLFLLVSLILLFPPILISMLEAGTVMEPLSKDMIRSFAPLRRFWMQFYAYSFGLGLIALVVFHISPLGGWFTILPCAAILTAIPFVYFRLLGRMAMMYRDYVAATTPVEEEEGPAVRHVLQ